MEPKYRTLIHAALIAAVLVVIAWSNEAPQMNELPGPNTVVDARSPH